jgi:hypothetical protein
LASLNVIADLKGRDAEKRLMMENKKRLRAFSKFRKFEKEW